MRHSTDGVNCYDLTLGAPNFVSHIMSSTQTKCPECGLRSEEEYVRCPNCRAWLFDASAWNERGHLPALIGAFLAWFLATVAATVFKLRVAIMFQDGISLAILMLGVYGLIILAWKWRATTRQIRAFRLVRDLDDGFSIDDRETLYRVRHLLVTEELNPYNDLIVYQRLCWLRDLAKNENTSTADVLETLRQQSDNDSAALDNSLATTQFLTWLLPTMGFLGTVYGMTQALTSFSQAVARGSDLGFAAGLTGTVKGLSTAFNTTLIGLAMVIPLLAIATANRRRAHRFLEQCDKYFLRVGSGLLTHRHNRSTPSPPEAVTSADQATTANIESVSMPVAADNDAAATAVAVDAAAVVNIP